MWRCANDIFNYCKAEPDWYALPTQMYNKTAPDDAGAPYDTAGVCRLDPTTCLHYETLFNHLKTLCNQHPARVPKHLLMK